VGASLQPLLLDIPEILESPRLTLRATRAGMGAPLHAAVVETLAQLLPWMPWARTETALEDCETNCREMQAKWHAREEIDFCIHRRADGHFVGRCGLHTIDWTIPRLEIGYWIRASCMGQGFATEAVTALAQFACEQFGARRLEITSDARNLASRRVAEKAGFTLEGVRRQARRDPSGALADSCMYARTF
jgi:RimJ/RimL family protein N-acetyltransferase